MIEIDIQKKLHTADGEIELRVDKRIEDGDFLTLFGKSGSGKTTLLRIIAGLETPESGRIVVDSEVWFDSQKRINLPPQKRGVGFVFQDYALFPNMSVRENLEFALKDKKQSQKVDTVLEMMELLSLSSMKPQRLSGGQKQRVALARSLMSEPKILLLDEPLSALDATLRNKLQEELVLIHERFGITSILVSHDISEVFRLSNRVLKIEKGTIVADASPQELFVKQKSTPEFTLMAEVLKLTKVNATYTLDLLVQGEVIEINAAEDEIQNLQIGEKILLSSKIINPTITRIQ